MWIKIIFKNQQEFLYSVTESSESEVKASFMLSIFITANTKRVPEGQFIRECPVKIVKIIWPERKYKILTRSAMYVERNIEAR